MKAFMIWAHETRGVIFTDAEVEPIVVEKTAIDIQENVIQDINENIGEKFNREFVIHKHY